MIVHFILLWLGLSSYFWSIKMRWLRCITVAYVLAFCLPDFLGFLLTNLPKKKMLRRIGLYILVAFFLTTLTSLGDVLFSSSASQLREYTFLEIIEHLGEVDLTFPVFFLCDIILYFVIHWDTLTPILTRTTDPGFNSCSIPFPFPVMIHSQLFSCLLSAITKYSTHRFRPGLDPNNQYLFDGPGTATINTQEFSNLDLSMPCGHLTNICAVMFAISLLFQHLANVETKTSRKQKWNMMVILLQCLKFGIIPVLGLSRVVSGAHWTSDVVAGVFFGVAVGYMSFKRYCYFNKASEEIRL